jgi:predicted metal-dependent hydrolase
MGGSVNAWLQALMARQLSLFDTEPQPVSAPSKPKVVLPPPTAVPPSALPLIPLPQALGSASFAHPQANRSVKLNGHSVGYWLKRGKRRTIGMLVGQDGLSVNAPRWAGVREIDAVLQDKADWILRKLAEVRERTRQRDAQRIDWAGGAAVPYLGQTLRLVLDGAHGWDANASRPRKASAQLVLIEDGTAELHLGLPQTASPAQIKDAAQAWLMRQALRVFSERLAHFAPMLGVRHTSLRLSSAATRWGSASAAGAIRLNWRLIHLPMQSLDYVVVHELSHLREMNHSPQFWSVVGSVLPDYAQRRQALKAHSSTAWE